MRSRGVAVVQILLFHASPDVADPRCICSLCRRPFTVAGAPEGEAAAGGPPIRLRMPKDDGKLVEIRLHAACFHDVFGPGSDPAKLRFRPGLHVACAYGDDEAGQLASPSPVTP